MADESPQTSESSSYHGKSFRPASEAERREAIEIAFDYRGDITLELTDGRSYEGYLFNRHGEGEQPSLQLYQQNQTEMVTILYADIAVITLSGEDTASGKSWETWILKKESQRKEEAARVEAEAKARGHL